MWEFYLFSCLQLPIKCKIYSRDVILMCVDQNYEIMRKITLSRKKLLWSIAILYAKFSLFPVNHLDCVSINDENITPKINCPIIESFVRLIKKYTKNQFIVWVSCDLWCLIIFVFLSFLWLNIKIIVISLVKD